MSVRSIKKVFLQPLPVFKTKSPDPATPGIRDALALYQTTRTRLAKLLTNARARIKASRERAVSKGYLEGYNKGYEEGFYKLMAASVLIENAYQREIATLKKDSSVFILKLAEDILERTIPTQKGFISKKLNILFQQLSIGHFTTLIANPLHRPELEKFLEEKGLQKIKIEDDSNCEVGEVTLKTVAGKVHYSWKQELQSLYNSSTRGHDNDQP